jgi:hypothetical protein
VGKKRKQPVVPAVNVKRGAVIVVNDQTGDININGAAFAAPPAAQGDADRLAFQKRTKIQTNPAVITFFQPPDAASLRHLARFPGKWAIVFDWSRSPDDDPFAPEVLRGQPLSNVTGIRFGDINLEWWIKEIVRPDSGFTSLVRMEFGNSTDGMTDASLKELTRPDSGLAGLTNLSVFNTHVTDVGVSELARPDSGLKSLALLDLCQTYLTDASLKEFVRPDSGLKALTSLLLESTQVTDAGLNELARPDSGLQALVSLHVFNTGVTEAGVEALQKSRPGLKINRNSHYS